MQIQCHHCRNLFTVNPQGGQFRCPTCGAINAVGAPVGTPIQTHHVAPSYAGTPRPAKKDNRKAYVLITFLVLGIGALIVGWWAIALGVPLLAWAIAGVLGKVTGPVSLLFPESTSKVGPAAVGIALGTVVTVCAVMGGIANGQQAEREAREAQIKAENRAAADAEREKKKTEKAEAQAAHEAALRSKAGKVAEDYGAGLDAVETLMGEEKWVEAEKKLGKVAEDVAEYRKLDPVPSEISALVPRHEALIPKLDAKRREQEIAAWIERAEAVVSDKSKCEEKAEVEAAREQVAGLQESDPDYAKIQELNAALSECLANMPPPSEWRYNVQEDPMGGLVATASVVSNNSLEFDFPYQGPQNAILTIRNDDGKDVILSVERGQFTCTMGCSVQVRFDDGSSERWRAVGASDYDTTVVFLRNTSKFLKKTKKATVLRIEAEFYQEGTRVLEFPVARFNPSKIGL